MLLNPSKIDLVPHSDQLFVPLVNDLHDLLPFGSLHFRWLGIGMHDLHEQGLGGVITS